MAQVRESCFRVQEETKDDIHLTDLHESGSVIVEKEHQKYSEELKSVIAGLTKGNILEAQIQSEDILQIDGIWRFTELSITTQTRMICRDEVEIPQEEANKLNYTIMTKGGAYRQFSPENEPKVDVVMFADRSIEEDWRELVWIDGCRDIYKELPNEAEPPFEIIHQRDKESEIIRTYYISNVNSEFGKKRRQMGEPI